MPSDKATQALFDIRDNALLANEFIAGLSFDQFKDDRLRFYAVTRALEIISEAARRLTPSMRDRHPELPWRAIMGLGNIYRHDYDNVALEYVWRTIHADLPALIAAINNEIDQLPPSPDEKA